MKTYIENVIEEMVGAIDELRRRCDVVLPDDTGADSVAGLLIEGLDRIPQVGETIRIGDHDLTVLIAEPNRVVRVLLERSPPDAEQDA